MLRINKILSKKIKYPLSLRGLFPFCHSRSPFCHSRSPFCHSREGGNPSSQSLRNDRSNLNKSGFSLIELMVAVVILAMAIFGIFLAFSTGFQGMADARDRTVATNYAREAMEDIKNMDFEIITTQSRAFMSSTKFEREVIVQESTNLKKVTTKVYWKDRNGNTKMVETNMLVHFLQTTAGDAARIMLFADPYNVLTEDNTETSGIDERVSIITAVVKDDKGNTVTTQEYDISFSITQVTESAGGSLSPSNKITINGIATTTFTASNGEGEVTITASNTGLTSDSVTIKVTDPKIPVKINLTASPMFMTPGSESTITATIVDAGGTTVTEATNEVTFSVSGPGALSNQTDLIDGVVKITLTSNSTPGTITVTASASELEPGVVDVITGGQISLSASTVSVPVNEKSEITVTTKDVDGVPIKYVGTIDLSVEATQDSNGSGSLFTYTLTFDGSTSSMTVTFTASSEGTVNITAEDQAVILMSADPLSLTITEALVPDHIAVYAEPSSIQAGGTESSTITARVKTADNVTITSYSELITFSTNLGTFPGNLQEIDTNNSNVTYENGVATVELYSSDTYGTATITVSSGSLDNVTVDVGFYIDADHIELVAVPQSIAAINGNTTTITATIVDEFGVPVNCNGSIIFSIVLGSDCGELIGSNPIVLDNQSQATIELSSNGTAGEVEVKAEANITSPSIKQLNSNITIEVKDITLELIEDPPPIVTFNIVTFNIEINGAVLNLNGMKVVWDSPPPPSKLNKIEIKSPSTAENYDPIIDTGNKSSPYTENNIDKNLLLGESSIRLTFSKNMEGIPLVVTFYTNYGDYELTIVE